MSAVVFLVLHIVFSVLAIATAAAASVGFLRSRREGISLLFFSLLSGALLYAAKGAMPNIAVIAHVLLYVLVVLGLLFRKEISVYVWNRITHFV